jgi:SMI1 / KNR4 family (SUKH-1)
VNQLGIILGALVIAIVFLVTGLIVCVVFDGINDGLRMLFLRILGFRGTEAPIEGHHPEYAARLRNPQFALIEVRFGARVPASLKRLYANAELLQATEFYVTDADSADSHDPDDEGGHFIGEFLPADKTALDHMPWDFEEPFLPFAGDMFGNYYCVLLRDDTPDPCPVYFWGHECGGTLEEMQIADSLDEFFSRPRRPGP